MRVRIIAKGGGFRADLARILRQRGVRVDTASWPEAGAIVMEAVSDAEPALVLLETETWDERTEASAIGLFGEHVTVQVVSAAAGDPAIRGRILAWGAAAAIPDDERVFVRCVAAVQWWVAHQQPALVRLGDLRFDTMRDELYSATIIVKLTGMERRLLWLLYLAAQAGRGPLSAKQVASELGSTAGAIRQHVRELRAKIEEDLGHARLIEHDRRGYFLELPPPKPAVR
ncbi:MAG: hypothetical protein ACR2JY_10850 [Chloroflexota bacterium]